MRKIIPVILSAVMAFSLCSCKSASGQTGTVHIWTATGSEKLMQEVGYEDRYGSTVMQVGVFRNEYEAAQIIVSPEYTVQEYSVKINDLRSADGNVLPSGAFAAYHEKYIYVEQLKDRYSPTGIGWYPDTLLPFDVAVEYDENKIQAGRNQGIWITVHPDKDQAAGLFTGNFEVTVDGKIYEVPVEVTVYDYTLSDEVHSKTSFGMGMTDIAAAELDSSVEMHEKYYDFLLNYRISAQSLPATAYSNSNELLQDALPEWLACAEKYTRDDRCSSFNLPYSTERITVSGTTITTVDFEAFEMLLREIVSYSVEKNINLLEKAGTYFMHFDEYDVNNTGVMASYNINQANALCDRLAQEYAQSEIEEPLKSEIVASLGGMKHKVVGELMDTLQVERATMVPKINRYHSQEQRDIYINWDKQSYVDNGYDGEMWTYTCWDPMAPSPTYHIEDVLLSSRLLSWMMYDYDIVGNLYWSVCKYQVRTGNTGDELPIQDYYSTPLRFPRANGDGYLLYPGREYGIYGPVASVRLESIRDGIEDYDLLYALENLYLEGGVTREQFDAFTQVLYNDLFSGTLVRLESGLVDSFTESRSMLAGLLVTASKTGLVIREYENADGVASFVLSAPNSTEVEFVGAEANSVPGADRTEYHVKIPLNKDDNKLSLTAEADGKSYTLEINLGGKTESVSGDTFADLVTFVPGGEAKADTVEDEAVTRLDVTAASTMVADVDMSRFNIGEGTSRFSVRIYLYGDEEREVNVLTKCAASDGFTVPTGMSGLKLSPGWNSITISATDLNFARSGELSALRFRFNSDPAEAVSFALGRLVIVR